MFSKIIAFEELVLILKIYIKTFNYIQKNIDYEMGVRFDRTSYSRQTMGITFKYNNK